MAEQALQEIQNLSSYATMSLITIGMIYSSILYVLSGLISVFTKWVYTKIDNYKKENKSNNV